MCVIPAYATGDWLGTSLSASVIHRVSALAQRSMSAIQVSFAPFVRCLLLSSPTYHALNGAI